MGKSESGVDDRANMARQLAPCVAESGRIRNPSEAHHIQQLSMAHEERKMLAGADNDGVVRSSRAVGMVLNGHNGGVHCGQVVSYDEALRILCKVQ